MKLCHDHQHGYDHETFFFQMVGTSQVKEFYLAHLKNQMMMRSHSNHLRHSSSFVAAMHNQTQSRQDEAVAGIQINLIFNIDIANFEKSILLLLRQYIAKY